LEANADVEFQSQLDEIEEDELLSQEKPDKPMTKEDLIRLFHRTTITERSDELSSLLETPIKAMPKRYATVIQSVESSFKQGKSYCAYSLFDGSDWTDKLTFKKFNESNIYNGYGSLLRSEDQVVSAIRLQDFRRVGNELNLPVEKEMYILSVLLAGKPIYVIRHFETKEKKFAQFGEKCIIEAQGTATAFNKIRGNSVRLRNFDETLEIQYSVALLIRSYLSRRSAKAIRLNDVDSKRSPTFPPTWTKQIVKDLVVQRLSSLPYHLLAYLVVSVNLCRKYGGLISIQSADVKDLVNELKKTQNKTYWQKIVELGINKTEEFKQRKAISNANYFERVKNNPDKLKKHQENQKHGRDKFNESLKQNEDKLKKRRKQKAESKASRRDRAKKKK